MWRYRKNSLTVRLTGTLLVSLALLLTIAAVVFITLQKRYARDSARIAGLTLSETLYAALHGTMLANDRREWVQSSEGRIYPYLFDSRCLMTTCAVENGRLDFKRVVEEGYWLFVNLPYSLLSEQITTLIGNLIITKLFYACMQRPPQGRHYRLILDEARFFNTGPLDRLLETSRAYHLWLTLVVQSLHQLCRSREGRVDYSLRDTALNNVRYWSAFNLTQMEDAQTLARLMFPLTGTVARGLRCSGDWDWQPPAVEDEQRARVFMSLRRREMLFFDKHSGGGPVPCRTPAVVMDAPQQSQVDFFETQHLRLIGRPAEAIMDEIISRRERVEALLGKGAGDLPDGDGRPRRLPPAWIGGML